MKKPILPLLGLMSLFSISQINATTSSFSLASVQPASDVSMISINYDVQYNCDNSICANKMKAQADGILDKYISKVLPTYSWKNMNPTYDNIIQLGYYDTVTSKSVFLPSCLIHINLFSKSSAIIKISKTGCIIS